MNGDRSDRTLALDLEPERYELREPGREPWLVDRRRFLKTLGGGLLILVCGRASDAAPTPSATQRRRGDGRTEPRALSAWLHIDQDGQITAYTGKVEVGQNVRTSLAQAVADELRVPLASIRMVMGDTDRVPFDMGTFGSLSTPRMAPLLRRAAAAARELLADLAATRLGVLRDQVVISNGTATARGQSIPFGELTRGQELDALIDEDQPTTPPERWTVAGRSEPKVDGVAFVTGRHRFTSDLKRPGMLYARVLRPPAYGATLKDLDDRAARDVPGAFVVRDGDLAAVAAPDPATAARALRALRAEWSSPATPPVADSELFEHLIRTAEPPREPLNPIPASDSDSIRLEARYTIAPIAHAPLEPRAAVAEWNGDQLTVWAGTQRPFGHRQELARTFNLPESQIHVLVPDTGSGYGGKHTAECAIEAARIARALRRPVQLVWTREEEFAWAYSRPSGVIDITARASRDGTLLDWQMTNINSGAAGLDTPYLVRGIKQIAFRPAQSPLRQGSYRALASTANHFARESMIDELARCLELDPLAVRLHNLSDERLRGVLTALRDHFPWDPDRPPSPGRGRGLACGHDKGSCVATAVEIEVNSDQAEDPIRILRVVTAFECGAIVNPDHLKSQVEGCLIQGLGGALFESLRFHDGMIRNGRFSRYRVPRFSDVPAIEVVLIDRKDLPSAGAGEIPIVAIAPAIANALHDATGQRRHDLPLFQPRT
ncbi:MAG: aldehyde oxidase [Isosphaeraceae bacterium]|jgi:isoquinoline 1-oxidoreductase|nr:MAG: aldehyde oxidase [Isosphaeraceae bacterium]